MGISNPEHNALDDVAFLPFRVGDRFVNVNDRSARSGNGSV
jgi:hypothetical protein